MKEVLILRGKPGTGKSYYAKHYLRLKTDLANATTSWHSADFYFEDKDGNYNFVPWQIPMAHQSCWGSFIDALASGDEYIVVDNTNTQRWEYENHAKLAKIFDYRVKIVNTNQYRKKQGHDITDQFLFESNVHGVPLEGIIAMSNRWEDDPSEIMA